MKRSDEQRIKLRAAYLNALAVAVFALGAIAPLIALFYATGPKPSALSLAIGNMICFAGSYGLHWLGSHTLRKLDKNDDARDHPDHVDRTGGSIRDRVLRLSGQPTGHAPSPIVGQRLKPLSVVLVQLVVVVEIS